MLTILWVQCGQHPTICYINYMQQSKTVVQPEIKGLQATSQKLNHKQFY